MQQPLFCSTIITYPYPLCRAEGEVALVEVPRIELGSQISSLSILYECSQSILTVLGVTSVLPSTT